MTTPNEQIIARLAKLGYMVITRTDWGSKYESLYQQRRVSKRVDLPVRYLFQHISVTRNNDMVSDMQELERIGYERFQSGISYNWAVDPITGEIGEGMPVDAKGTHTVNDKGVPGFPLNLNYYGNAIVAIGMPGVVPTAKFALSCAAIMRATWDLGIAETNCGYYPHSMFANKDCPTDPVRAIMPNIRNSAINLGRITMAAPDWWADPLPSGQTDKDGTPVTFGEAIQRGLYAYGQVTEIGPEGNLLDRVKALETP